MDAVGKPLELALKAMGFEDKMRELAKSIESELGLTVISDKIKELGGFIDVISENIKKINLGDITSKVQEVGHNPFMMSGVYSHSQEHF
jgi:hypothetical protein